MLDEGVHGVRISNMQSNIGSFAASEDAYAISVILG